MGERVSETAQIAQRYLNTFGVDWSAFNGKRILDLGAAGAAFALKASKRGIQVVSLEIIPEFYIQEGHFSPEVAQKVPYVKGDMTNLPFRDGVFDLVLAHSLGGIILLKRGQIIEGGIRELVSMTREAIRVLKPGGEFWAGPMGSDKRAVQRDLRLIKSIHEQTEMREVVQTYAYGWREFFLASIKG